MLDAGEALLLGSRHDYAVFDEARGRVVIHAADAQDLHP
jgi:hypothetical protein